ncbi:MAG TPA: sulfur carrier protein ThiS [Rhizobiales bacterium]|nr:sulfur carrier protein ThiS [bacterium BMS3Bbin10]HDO51382.1 sulfur carrier protein ThiS [Hyphomicrobiales bacterium]
MKITVNGELTETRARTLGELCSALGHGRGKIATARNGDFVPVTERAKTLIAENDKIEIVAPRQGG